MKKPRVLIACEESQAVTIEMRKLGIEAWSCDIEPCSGGHPEWHVQGDVVDILNDGWDMMIAHPPCTYLCRHRSRWEDLPEQTANAKNLFCRLLNSNIDKICIENPVPQKKWGLPPYNQIIQPYQFGHDYSKKTCLWLKNLPLLKPTETVELTYYTTPNGKRFTKGWYFTPRNSKARSKTFPGIARAMAFQWGGLLLATCENAKHSVN